ncbi:MAG: HAMP domain-containing histidine kinase [Bacteroidetes bacterium]|nr:HAMP domain-containing histidine kinase [Bacteroidota bacterium]
MKKNRTNIFIAISSIALLIVLIIQLNWISQTAKNKEEVFNEKATIVRARVTESLSKDKVISQKLQLGAGKNERRKIDSLLKQQMNFYNFHADYFFEVIPSMPPMPLMLDTNINASNSDKQPEQACYTKSLDELSNKNGWELKLTFPNKEESILSEMGAPFITAVVLILIVLILFWRTTLSLIAEKRIAEHTTDFLNNMTHEFKTPLTNISLAGKMITKDSTSKNEEKIKHYSSIILEENEKLRLQVEQVLSMTALERGEIPLQKTELDFHQLLSDCLKSINIQIENKQGDLKLNLNADNIVVTGDKTHLANAFSNLIDNAIKYSKEKPAINIQTVNRDQHLIITITDKGIGIDKQYHKQVFGKYFRVPTGNVHDIKGFGLGLAYVKKIIELHGGAIELESELGNGTTFTITLPNA